MLADGKGCWQGDFEKARLQEEECVAARRAERKKSRLGCMHSRKEAKKQLPVCDNQEDKNEL